MAKTIQQINEKIKKGEVVVVNAEEIIDIVDKKGVKKASQEIDVVTTGTFSPMCSSGAYINIGTSKPKLKLGGGKATINNVSVYTGFAAADIYIGAAALPDEGPRNKFYPGDFTYGGGHVIEDLVSGKDLKLKAIAYGTDCYPRKELDTLINIKDLNEAVLFNLRNASQNYNVAVNLSNRIIYTYMGELKANLGNANYCTAGQLSPLLNDPLYKTIGIGTKIFLGGGEGYITWHGTQHNPSSKRKNNDIPKDTAATISVIGNLKNMSAKWLRGTSMKGYGATLTVGIGIPIPILNEEICRYTAIKDKEIYTTIRDYSQDYPNAVEKSLGEINYEQLKSGKITIKNKEVPTGSLSSYKKAKEISNILKDRIKNGDFLLTQPIASLPGPNSGYKLKPLKEREVK